jgi:small redox-active disulfide protein 2
MKQVIVYGTGCKNCIITADKLLTYAQANNIEITLVKETDMMAIMQAGVMSTPSIAVDGKVCHSGSVPSDEQIAQIFS